MHSTMYFMIKAPLKVSDMYELIETKYFPAVTSKSSGIVGKWGSFSSMRPSTTASIGMGVGSSSDLKRGSSTNAVIAGAPKPKKFFKSREAVAPIEDDMDFTDSSVSQVSNTLPFLSFHLIILTK